MVRSRLLLYLAALTLCLLPVQAWAGDGDDEEEAKSPWSKDPDAPPEGDKDGDEDGDKGDEDAEDPENTDEAPEAEPEPEPAQPPVVTSTKRERPTRSSPGAVLPSKGGGALGLGFAVGTINGLSLKIWPHAKHGIVFHLGVPNVLNSAAASLSYRVHPKEIRIPDSPVGLHVNLGPLLRVRAAFGAAAYVELAGGLAVGVSLTVDDVPAEIFFEVAPVFAGSVTTLGAGLGFDVDGVVGARFFF